jgi:hypothetical protein
MTDRHTVNKRYKKLLEKEKETKIDVLGIEMTEEERDSACSVNGLFCGLHIGPQISFPMIPNALHSASNVSFFILF